MRLLVLGPGAAGKSTFARSLSEATGIPCVELDEIFWSSGPSPIPHDQWIITQEELTRSEDWILDGDLGPYDALEARLRRADTIVLFDFPTWRCIWRAARRSRERIDFWRWLVTWRRRYRPQLLQAIETYATDAELIVATQPAEVDHVAHALAIAAEG